MKSISAAFVAAFVIVMLAVGGCQSIPAPQAKLKRSGGTARVVLMPLDIRVAQMSSLGLMLPAARWTREATVNVRDAALYTTSASDSRA